MDGVWHIDKGSYPTPQVGWTITGTSYPPVTDFTTTITSVTDEGATWGITGAGIGNNGVIASQPVTFFNPVYPAIWETIPFSAFGTPLYSNVNVASYLPTYSGNVANISFANGNINLGAIQSPASQAGTLLNVKGIVGLLTGLTSYLR
jgi:hypothetical protein